METPPRTWGKLIAIHLLQNALGNTPTYVGKTHLNINRQLAPPKHPHVRGENFYRKFSAAASKETPPRTWGKRERCGEPGLRLRNTPTYVGKTAL